MYILMGGLIVGLTGFGISNFTGGSLRNIGSVGDQKISINDYASQMNQTLNSVSRQIGRNLSAAEVQASGIQRSVLAGVVANAAITNESEILGISVGDKAVQEELLATPSFKSLTGEFDEEAYRFTLSRLGQSAAEYEESIRRENARNLIQSSVATGVVSDGSVAEMFVTYAGEERQIEWIELTADNLSEPVGAPTEEQLVEQYELNPQAYTSPLTRDITYVWLRPEDLTDQAQVTDTEIQEYYDQNAERYNRPARRAIDRIVFPSQQEAEDARARLDSGVVDFDGLAEERGLTVDDIDQGEVEVTDLTTDEGNLIFGSAEPGVVGPANSNLGPALYRINAIFDAQNDPLEEVRDEIVEELAAEHTSRMILEMMPEIDDKLAAGATLEELAQETALTLDNISFADEDSDGIAAYDEFRAAAVQAKEGDFPEILRLDDGGIFALRVNGITEPARIPLEEIRDQVVNDWTAAETVRRLRDLAEGYAARLVSDPDFGSLGLLGNIANNISRNGFIEGTPPTLVSQLFAVDQFGTVIVDDVQSVFLAMVTDITDYDLNNEDAQATVARIQTQLDQQIAQDILSAYGQAVQERAGVQLDQGAINAVNTQIFSSLPATGG